MSVTIYVNGSLESALKIFKQKCEKENIFSDIKRKIYFKRPGLILREKHMDALRRARRLAQ